MNSNNKNGKFSVKGYYIALILCAAAIGITGYLYYRNANQNDTLQKPDPDASVSATDGTDVEAVAPGDNSDTDSIQDNTEDTQNTVLKTCSPLEGNTIASYAMECLAYNATTRDWRTHDGIDIAAEAGTTVCAAADGTVYTTYNDDSMGMTVVIRHENGYVTVYSSLDENISVTAGDTVTMGQAIGRVGNTALLETAVGDHLHFSVTCNGKPMDPETFFDLG